MLIGESTYATSRSVWRRWLARHHTKKREIWLVYYKKSSGKTTVAYAEAVEEALCFGWIDTTVKTIDPERYAQRFVPRKPRSNWSTPNLKRVKRLGALGLMTPAGAAHIPSPRAANAFHAKHEKRLTGTIAAPPDLAAALRRNAKASAVWKTLAPGYRRLYVRWITDAKRAETRTRRVASVVDRLSQGIKHPMV
ncbi:MAG: YdeI/OmpD-associated family protein [Gemmatimonadetes bacterium]|nr:YdeI/OmpD-associated family protein [Gemmatimonadota bacterium]